MSIWPRLALVCILTGSARDAVGQTSAKQPPRSTKIGVYSREQADRGQDVYLGMCKSCHTPEFHTAPTFTAKWNGKRLSALYEYIRDEMPKNEPGSLSEQEYVDVLAYVLKLNHMPSGKVELPSDPKKLGMIRFDMKNPIKVTKPSRGSSP